MQDVGILPSGIVNRMNEFKYGKKSITYHLLEINTFIKDNKFNTHQEDM